MTNNPQTALLESRAVLRLTGADHIAFLQGLTSNDVTATPVFTALLTPQGKYLADFIVLREGDALLLDVEAETKADFMKRLSMFRLRADVALEDVSDQYRVFACWNDSFDHGFTDPRLPALGQRVVAPADNPFKTNAMEKDYRMHRYRHGVAESSREILVNKAVLLEVNFDALNGISLTKGCYMGQELTARTHYRGLIKKRYLPFRYEGAAPHTQHILHHENAELGQIMALEENVGLGLFNLERVKPFALSGSAFQFEDTSYYIHVPEYLSGQLGNSDG